MIIERRRQWLSRARNSASGNATPLKKLNEPAVLFIDHSGLPGGGQLGLARYLESEAGREAAVVVLGDGPAFDNVSTDRIRRQKGSLFFRSLLRGPRFVDRAVTHSRAQVVVANSLKSAAIVALAPRRSNVVYLYYLRVDMDRAKMSIVRWVVLSRFLLPRFDGYLSNSNWTATTIPAHLGSRPARVAYPVSGTASLESIPPIDGLRSPPITILSLSRVVQWKGIHVLVEALRILSREGLGAKFRAIIAGGDFHEESGYAMRLESELPSDVDVSFVGHQSDVSQLLENADVVVSCSLVPEPFGQVIAQGLAAARPVVATNAGGPREMVRHNENGLLVEPGDARALASALRRFLDEPELLRDLSSRARSTSVALSDSRTTQSLSAAIEELVATVNGQRTCP